MKLYPAITLLSKLCRFRLSRVPNNLYDSTEMLNVDEGVTHTSTINWRFYRSNLFCRFRTRGSYSCFLSGNARSASNAKAAFHLPLNRKARVLRRTQPLLDTHVSTSKHETRIFNSKHDGRISTQCDGRILRPCEALISIEKHETHVQNGLSSGYNRPKSPHP